VTLRKSPNLSCFLAYSRAVPFPSPPLLDPITVSFPFKEFTAPEDQVLFPMYMPLSRRIPILPHFHRPPVFGGPHLARSSLVGLLICFFLRSFFFSSYHVSPPNLRPPVTRDMNSFSLFTESFFPAFLFNSLVRKEDSGRPLFPPDF